MSGFSSLMPAELCTQGSNTDGSGEARGKGKRCDLELQLQLPFGVGMARNKTHWVFCDSLETASSGRAFVPVFLHPPAASALQNSVTSLGAFHKMDPVVFGFLGMF